jgi:glycosyltransferase involved in cell wall biosynthesis
VTTERRTICVLGHHELDYPRNIVSQRLIRAAGYDIVLVHSRAPDLVRELELLVGLVRHRRRIDAVFVTEGGHRHVPLVKAVARTFNCPVIFDAFTSRYSTYVEDRKTTRPGSPRAYYFAFQDFAAVRAADYLVFDTVEHRDYFRERYGARASAHVIEVGVDEQIFQPRAPAAARNEGPFQVLFYVSYIPLHGIDTIVEAARRLERDPSIQFRVVGSGQEYPRIRARVDALSLRNLVLEAPVALSEIASQARAADVCLGIFGTTDKAARVVPNKVVQCAALGRPIVTMRCPAIARYFEDGHDARLVPPGDPEALVAAIVALRDDPGQMTRIARGARRTFERHFAEDALLPKMQAVLDAATDPGRVGRSVERRDVG